MHGFIEEEGEDCIKKIVDMCKGTMGIQLEASDIDRAHRVGKPRCDKPRAIIVKLKSHSDMTRLIKARSYESQSRIAFHSSTELYICFLSLVNRRKIFAKRSQDNIIK
jgi:hypothetical protein